MQSLAQRACCRTQHVMRAKSTCAKLNSTTQRGIAPLAAPLPRIGTSRRSVETRAWRSQDDDRVVFDDEDEWERQGTYIEPNVGSFLQQGLRAVGIITDRLTDVALQFAPEDASPSVVRTAVGGGLVLLALSFVKGLLSLFLMIGTVIFGAYVAVRIFGLDVNVAGVSQGKRRRRKDGRIIEQEDDEYIASKGRKSKKTRQRRSEFEGLLGPGNDDDEDDGLLDVWFETGSSNSKSSGSRRRSGGHFLGENDDDRGSGRQSQ